MNLPDLKQYRVKFEQDGVKLPLPQVRSDGNGLLVELPEPPPGKTGWPWTIQTDLSTYSKEISWPKLSIITPSYNQGAFIEETIRSVLLQNYPNLEYIIIDGGSTDNTKAILEKYSPWISYWQSEKDDGQAQAINKGFSLASGKYYAWINSDDYYLADVFHIIISTFLTHKTKFVYGYGYNLDLKSKKQELVKMLPFTDFFIKIPSLVQPSCFWNADIHQLLWEELHCALDFELWLRLVKGNKRKLIKHPLSVAQTHDDAKTSNPKMKAQWHKDHLKIWSADAHGTVYEWRRIVFLNRLRHWAYRLFNK